MAMAEPPHHYSMRQKRPPVQKSLPPVTRREAIGVWKSPADEGGAKPLSSCRERSCALPFRKLHIHLGKVHEMLANDGVAGRVS
jgi:hypothetical protein